MRLFTLSFLVLFVTVFVWLLVIDKVMLALLWLVIAIANALSFYRIYRDPSYYERTALNFIEETDGPVTRLALLEHIKREAPNLKTTRLESVVDATINRLQRRGLITMNDDTLEKGTHHDL